MHKMQKLASVSLLAILLSTAAVPGWTISLKGKPGKIPSVPAFLDQVQRAVYRQARIRLRPGEWPMFKAFLRSNKLAGSLQDPTSRPTESILKGFDPRRSFSGESTKQPTVRMTNNILDIYRCIRKTGEFPKPDKDPQAFEQAVEVAVSDPGLNSSFQDVLVDLYIASGDAAEAVEATVALPKRSKDIDVWMKTTPLKEQEAALHAALLKIKKSKEATEPKINPSQSQAEPVSSGYYSAEEALGRLDKFFSKENSSRNNRHTKKELPSPFGENIDDFWAMLSVINADKEGLLPQEKKHGLFWGVGFALKEKVKNPQLLMQEVRAWQGLQQKWPTLPDPAQYKTPSAVSKAPMSKKLEWKLALEGWGLKNLIPEGKQPQWLQHWDPFDKWGSQPPVAQDAKPAKPAEPAQAITATTGKPQPFHPQRKTTRHQDNTGRLAGPQRHNPQAQETQLPFQNVDATLASLDLSYPSSFPSAYIDPENFLHVRNLLAALEAGKLSPAQQEKFLKILKDSDLGDGSEIWTKELFDKEIDLICSDYNIEKTLYLPSPEDYPTVQSIQKENKGLKKLWSVLLALRACQIAFPEQLDPALQRLKLSFDDKPAKPVAAKPT